MNLNYNFEHLIDLYKFLSENFLVIFPLLSFPIILNFVLKLIRTLPTFYQSIDYNYNDDNDDNQVDNYEENNEFIIDDDKFNYGFFRK